MDPIIKCVIDSAMEVREINKDEDVKSLIEDMLNDKISLEQYSLKMMELALARGKALNAYYSGNVYPARKAPSVVHSDRRGGSDVNGTQFVRDSTIDNAMEIPALEAIFANANPEDYLDQVLAVAVHQAWVIQKIEAALKLK